MSNPNALTLISDLYDSSDAEDTNTSALEQLKTHRRFSNNNDNSSKLPVPESLKTLFCESADEDDNDSPELHGGRIRSFPHERGNWATSVYVPCKRSSYLSQICNSFMKICNRVSDFSECSDFHVSLSRTVVIRHHWIEPLVQDIKEKIQISSSFPLDLDDVDIYVNDEKTRTFVALKVGLGSRELLNLVSSIDSCLSEFRLQTYYEDPSFHLSLIWCVGDKKKELIELKSLLLEQYNSVHDRDFQLEFLYVKRICCKTGNRIFNFDLKPS